LSPGQINLFHQNQDGQPPYISFFESKFQTIHSIFEVNRMIGEVWDFVARFDDKCWEKKITNI